MRTHPWAYVFGISSNTRGKNPAIPAAVAKTKLEPRLRHPTGKTDVASNGAFKIQKVDVTGKHPDTKIHAPATPPKFPAAIMGRAKIVQSVPPKAHVQYQPLTSPMAAANGVMRT
mmetsp:Transcript_196/g.404  ORF Transcript_196/g.404 Transcript_196/m.404 type:complete len:115 (+) Transcript_196:207-551(+)